MVKYLTPLLLSLFILLILQSPILIGSSYGQIVKGDPNGIVTITPMRIFEFGLKIEKDTQVQYTLNADTLMLFDIHSHQGNQIITHLMDESKTFEGVFVAPKDGNYYFLAMNLAETDATLQYNILLRQNTLQLEYQDTKFDINTLSNSAVEIISFNPEHKQILIRVHTPYLTPGFVNISIPRILLDGPFEIQGSLTELSYSQDESSTAFIINTPLGIHDVTITGTTAIPEIPFPALLLTLTLTSFLFITRLKWKNRIYH